MQTENIKTKEDAIEGAKYIIAEWISDNAAYRKYIRTNMYKYGVLETKKKKNDKDENGVYEMYYAYSEPVSKVKPHRILAINRAEKEDVINRKAGKSVDHAADDGIFSVSDIPFDVQVRGKRRECQLRHQQRSDRIGYPCRREQDR